MDLIRKQWTRGTHRTRPPEETLRLVQPLLAQVGVTRVADVTGLDSAGIPTVMVVRPNGRSLSVTQGKGLTLEEAKVSGIMEAIEHDRAESCELPLILGRIGSLLHRVCDLDALPAFPRIYGPLTSDTRLLWTEAEDLAQQCSRLVPYELVHLDLTLPMPESTGHFPLSSNGLASGNTLLEATVHALLELIERDARTLFAMSSDARRADRRVVLDSIDDHDANALIERLAKERFSVAIWDLTSDLGIPAFQAGVLERDDNIFRRVPVAYGSGAHLDRRVALTRALTEAAQTRLTNIVGARDDTLPDLLERARDDELQTRSRELLLQPGGLRDFRAIEDARFDSFERDLGFVLERLARAGMHQVLRVDLSCAGWPVHVVRMIVPGLEPYRELTGYRPGARARARLAQS